MTRPTDEIELRKFLAPFADGELDVERSLRVLEHMAMNPQATKRVMHQQQLRQSVARHFIEHAPQMPQNLAAELAALFPPLEAQRPPARGRRLRAGVILLAAAVLVGAGAWAGRVSVKHSAANISTTNTPFSTAIVNQVIRLHVRCSRYTAHNHGGIFPDDLTKLPGPVEKYLGKPAVLPKFDELGMQFMGAEVCPLSGAKSIHLLYRGKDAMEYDSISLFIQLDDGSQRLAPNVAYDASTPAAPHPVYLWRNNGLIYYLTANAHDVVKRAAKIAGPGIVMPSRP